ncbi:hypothetical protein [Jeotgalibacillus sp. JSM ZJ347]|uniref:hypothetical protein n=1 Tax=Jeotgalibacillus sp. JSM ZJ347 TaxID=3342117 RepID=UPI0035A8895E
MKKQTINFEYLATVSPVKMQLYLLAAGISLSVQECTKLQLLLKKNINSIQSLPHILNEAERILGKKRVKDLILKAASYL